MDTREITELKIMSAKARRDVLKMLQWRGYGHLGGSMSIIEVLSVLYNRHMKHRGTNSNGMDKDYLVLSKGHSGPGLYATLAEQEYFPKDMLFTLNEGGTKLPSHPDRLLTPGVDATTGSLGQGTSLAAGLGYALRLEGSDRYVYLIVGDGELNEGQCWEAFQFIAHHALSKVIVFIDENKKQLDGYTKDIINPFDLRAKMESFGFYTQKVKGNDEKMISEAIDAAKEQHTRANCIILDTIKGQGVKYFEDMQDNHSVKFQEKDHAEIDKAVKELEQFIEDGGLSLCGN